MIDVQNLEKVFVASDGSPKRAVDGVSFQVEEGKIYGLLGPNGAGKTTTLRMLSGLMRPTRGRAFLAGKDVSSHQIEVKKQVGFLTANTGLYQRLSPREVLLYFAALQGLEFADAESRVDELITWLDIAPFSNLRCGALSTGQKQRVNIGRALVGNPPILIMDEPTLGLDVLSNRIILDFIRSAAALGKTIIVSTHYLDEAESLCDTIGFLHGGRIIAEGNLEELQAKTGHERLTQIFLSLIGEDQPKDKILKEQVVL